jgi:tryptophanyl-tRNA synthetase
MSKKLVSGIQSTGNLHLGNYLGAIKNWINLQDSYDCRFFIADLHSITVGRQSEELRDSIYDTLAMYIACGIDPEKAAVFTQSSINEHPEMAWLFSCVTPLGWMYRMTQFKDKAPGEKEEANLGLLAYPVLMAADILLYNADVVPVGEDQKQHLELTRSIATLINNKFRDELGRDFFKLPEPLINSASARVMSLRDGTSKMSKSDKSDNSRINLKDSPELITKKIKKAKTDSYDYISYDPESRPDIGNLLKIYAAFEDKTPEKIAEEFAGSNFAGFKAKLAELVSSQLEPINNYYYKLIEDKSYLETILLRGKEKAGAEAKTNTQQLKQLFGYINV